VNHPVVPACLVTGHGSPVFGQRSWVSGAIGADLSRLRIGPEITGSVVRKVDPPPVGWAAELKDQGVGGGGAHASKSARPFDFAQGRLWGTRSYFDAGYYLGADVGLPPDVAHPREKLTVLCPELDSQSGGSFIRRISSLNRASECSGIVRGSTFMKAIQKSCSR
jgi:hypothetical protein